MRLDSWISQAAFKLEAAGVESARLEAQLLAAHFLGRDRTWVLTHPETEVPETIETLSRRLAREPLAYILGYREFYGRLFCVQAGVLIPRQETEAVIEAVLELTLPIDAKALDIGTGSGCLAATLALERPGWNVTATDISAQALEVAATNAAILGARVRLLQGDLFAPVQGETFDIIVSNPPYVAEGTALMPEVVEYEPKQALFAGASGNEFYARLAQEAARYLRPGGFLVMEMGDTSAAPVERILMEEGWQVWFAPDLLKIPRVALATRG